MIHLYPMTTTRPEPLDQLALLSRLWLAEPTADEIAVAQIEFGLPAADAGELAEAFVELFVLGVPPYASVFTEVNAEMNGWMARWMEARFRRAGFVVPAGIAIAASDHLGLGLAYLGGVGKADGAAVEALSVWAPVCCHTVEIEPGGHPFYAELARVTREAIGDIYSQKAQEELDRLDSDADLALNTDADDLVGRLSDPEAEVGFPDVVRFFLAPARCGVYLSRSWWGRSGRALGLAAPFGSRFEVAAAILRQAGESERADAVLGALDEALVGWDEVYESWAETGRWGRVSAQTWRARVAAAREVTLAMRAQLASDQ